MHLKDIWGPKRSSIGNMIVLLVVDPDSYPWHQNIGPTGLFLRSREWVISGTGYILGKRNIEYGKKRNIQILKFKGMILSDSKISS